MLRILDRYVLRELMAPFGLSLLLLTFALEIPPILQHGETLIAEGASWDVVVRVLATLLPQALGITIPMALLVGILITLGRLSGDREIVAMEACGVSLGRLLRPLLLFGLVATAATTYVMIVALPAANQAFREMTFKLLMTRGETKIKPRVFYTDFPNLVIYVREVTPGVGWTDVMVSESSTPTQPKTYLAKKGRLLLDESKRTVQMVLIDGTHHSVNLDEPEKYEQGTFDADDARDRSRERVSAHRPHEGRHGDDHRGAQSRDGGSAEAEHLPAQPDHVVAEEVLDSRRLPRLHAGRARHGRQPSPRRPPRRLRPRYRRRVRLLDSDVHVGSHRKGAACCPTGLRGSRCGCRILSSRSGALCSS